MNNSTSLSIVLGQPLKQTVDIAGGVTESIFTEVGDILINSPDHLNALEYVAARKKIGMYWSVIDFMSCELNRKHRTLCRRFYAGKGGLLKDTLTEEEIAQHETMLLKALEVACYMFEQGNCKSWVQYCGEVKRAMSLMPSKG